VTQRLLFCLHLPAAAAHLPFSHHNLLPSMNRKHGTSMPFKAVEVPTGNTPEDAAARPDFCLPHQAPVAAFEFPSGGSAGSSLCQGLGFSFGSRVLGVLEYFVLWVFGDFASQIPKGVG
jgi:hypothetical protein